MSAGHLRRACDRMVTSLFWTYARMTDLRKELVCPRGRWVSAGLILDSAHGIGLGN